MKESLDQISDFESTYREEQTSVDGSDFKYLDIHSSIRFQDSDTQYQSIEKQLRLELNFIISILANILKF